MRLWPVGLTSSCSPGSQIPSWAAASATLHLQSPPSTSTSHSSGLSAVQGQSLWRHTTVWPQHQPPADWKTLFISSVYCNLRVICRNKTNFQNSSPNIGNVAKLQRPVWENWRPADRDIIIWEILGGILSVMNCAREVCLREPASVPADRVPDWAVGSTTLLLTGPSISDPRRGTQTPSHWPGAALNLSAWRSKINFKFTSHSPF